MSRWVSILALAGTWEADSPAAGKLTNTIALVSKGTAIEETIGTPEDNEVSLYTRDAGRIAPSRSRLGNIAMTYYSR